jgi:flagellar biosynthetic protein FliR
VIDLSPILALGLLLVRPGALIMASPAFGGVYAPAPVKIGLILFLALALTPVTAPPAIGSGAGLAIVIARESAIGIALALGTRVLFAAAEFAGHLAGFQMGLSYSAIVDPASGVRNNVLATLYSNVAMVTFLLTNAHHAFLRALRDSYDRLPIGSGAIGASLPQSVTAMLGLVFSVGTRLAAPVIIVLLICELALALVARSAPALNLMVVSAPVRLAIGLILLGVVTPAAVGVLAGFSSTVLQAGLRAADAFR